MLEGAPLSEQHEWTAEQAKTAGRDGVRERPLRPSAQAPSSVSSDGEVPFARTSDGEETAPYYQDSEGRVHPLL